jgi:N-acylneuraminate cytidylyltransferase/CMP-N,N'-diacetyllegionaminic acid synthase
VVFSTLNREFLIVSNNHSVSKSTQVVAIIPARGGSKGIPQKNIHPLDGKPLIAYTIEVAFEASCVDRVIVTTDDPLIANVAQRYDAEVPFLRPPELARDNTPGIAPLLHAIRWLEHTEDYRPEYVVLLQPTSPFRTAEDIDASYQQLKKCKGDAIVSICASHQHPYWMLKLTEDGRLTSFLRTAKEYVRRQDLPDAYAYNGAIYLAKREVVLAKETFDTDRTYGYVMPPERSLDIDGPWELQVAELVMQHRRLHAAV